MHTNPRACPRPAARAAARAGMVAILGMSEMWAREREEIATRPREGLGRPPGPEEIAQAWRELHGPEPDHPVAW